MDLNENLTDKELQTIIEIFSQKNKETKNIQLLKNIVSHLNYFKELREKLNAPKLYNKLIKAI